MIVRLLRSLLVMFGISVLVFLIFFARDVDGKVSLTQPAMMLPSNSKWIDSRGTPLVSGTKNIA